MYRKVTLAGVNAIEETCENKAEEARKKTERRVRTGSFEVIQ